VPCVSRSCPHFSDDFNLHLLLFSLNPSTPNMMQVPEAMDVDSGRSSALVNAEDTFLS
jgi:hypothetical protein